MANFGLLGKVWRQSLELNIRYYSAVSRLTADYYKDLIATLADLRVSPSQPRPQPHASPVGVSRATSAQPTAPVPASPQVPPATAAPSPQAGVMALEGEAGGQALGVFLVANNLRHEVSARVVASTFVDANGRTVQPAFIFDPEVIMLAPGEQLLVRVMTLIDDSLEPEVRYRGEFTVPELSSTRIPIVLHRRPNQAESSVEANSAVAGSPQKTKSPGRGRSTKTKRAVSGGEKSSQKKS